MRLGLVVFSLALSAGCSSTSTNEGNSGGGAGTGGTGGTVVGCADDSVEQVYSGSATMVGCNGKANQCKAETLCAAGWHLCTYAEYVAQGGATEKATANRWLSGCVRQYESNVLTCPDVDEGVCGNACASTSADTLNVSFACDGSQSSVTEQVNLGIAASDVQSRPGCAKAACSFVDVVTSSAGTGLEEFGATCCK